MSGLLAIDPADPTALEETGSRLRSVFIETYGCQMNLSDSELMRGVLRAAGYREVLQPESADVVLLNTCAIREHAEERIIGRLNQLGHLKIRRPDMVLGVCGCMAKHLAEDLMDRVPVVDVVMGPDSYRRLPQLIEEAASDPTMDVRLDRDEDYLELDPARTQGTNAWITIMRGCDKFCTFCIVPYVRGRERSVSAREVIRQVEGATADGFREVTLLGQTVNSFHDGKHDFADLLERIAAVRGIERIRFTSPHPSDFPQKLIDVMATEDKICNFVHLPVQSGSDRILEAMKRTYTVSEYLKLVGRLRESLPGLCLSTDVIVGFPGETEADFEETIDLMEQVGYDSAFLFKYSDRAGTVAHRERPETVSEPEKGRRLEKVIHLQEEVSARINKNYIGRTLSILVEGDAPRGSGDAIGKSGGFKKVVFPRESARDNTFVGVKIVGSTSHTLRGFLVDSVDESRDAA